MTEVQGIAPLRHRLYHLCLDGDGRVDWTAVAALKTHVSLQEALELEAVQCEAGDRRHAFQAFYPEWKLQDDKRRKAEGADLSKLGQLDPARLLEDINMTKQAIDEHEAMLADHRAAIVDGVPSQLTDADVDATYAILESLRGNLPVMQAELDALNPVVVHHDGGNAHPVKGGR